MAKSEIHKSMPVDIEVWMSSPFIQAMNDSQEKWYFRLLMNAWRSGERPCYLRNDSETLRILAGARTTKYWDEHKALVLERFEVTPDRQWIFNVKQLDVYERQMEKYQSYKERGKHGGEANALKLKDREKPSSSLANRQLPITPVCDVVCEVAVDVGFKKEPIYEQEFDAEPHVRRVQACWSWKPGGHAGEAAFCQAVEFESKERKCSLEEAAKWLADRAEMVADIIRDWPRSEHQFRPRLDDFFNTRNRRYANELSSWERNDGQQQQAGGGAVSKTEQREDRAREVVGNLRRRLFGHNDLGNDGVSPQADGSSGRSNVRNDVAGTVEFIPPKSSR